MIENLTKFDDEIFKKIRDMNSIFDTHAHYNDPVFENNYQEVIDFVLSNGVSHVCNMSANLDECESSIKIAQNYENICCAVGIHPINTKELEPDWISKLENYAKQKKVVAIGEIGLDYNEKGFDKKTQIEVFKAQLDLARRLNKPVAIHSRDAIFDTIETLKKFPDVHGVVHCFSGSVETASILIDMGFFLGFTGIVTFKNAKVVKEVAKSIPLSNMVIETDCPFLAPEPWRSKTCNSAMLVSVIKTIAEIREVDVKTIVESTRNNAFKLYGLN